MRVLVTGSGGVVGVEVMSALSTVSGVQPVPVLRRDSPQPGAVCWRIGQEPAPDALRGPWDAIVHLAAATRWTLHRDEALAANVEPLRAVLALQGPETHLVHVSTAFVGGARHELDAVGPQFDGYRNGYEWSKALCEDLVRERAAGPYTVIRPPLIIGSRTDGAISRFTGPYTMFQALVSGLAAVVVGDPAGYVEVAPVDQVAAVVRDAVLRGPVGTEPRVIAAGPASMRLAGFVSLVCDTVNGWRDERGLAPIAVPPFVSRQRWHRFFLPLAHQYLSPVQRSAVELLGMFESYTSMAEPFRPTDPVVEPAAVLTRSIQWWAQRKPRLAARTPESWALIGQ